MHAIDARFQNQVDRLPGLFDDLISSEPFQFKPEPWQKNKKGIYVFFEDSKAVHIGRTRNLQGRLRSHITKSHNSASFAFKRTRLKLKLVATYKPIGSRKFLTQDEIFYSEFVQQIEILKSLEVRFLELEEPVVQYLLELYGCIKFELPLDEFDTH